MHPERLLTLLLTLLLVAATGRIAPAQTPTTTIKNSQNDTRLQTFFDGGLLAPGIWGSTTPADSIPAEGGGTRMMWYPAKAAFRAGRVFGDDSDAWNAENVGEYSVAFGESSEASGQYAMAMGDGADASGEGATAIGVVAEARGVGATALGFFATVPSGVGATAMGADTYARGSGATAMGAQTVADAPSATAMGSYTTAAEIRSLTVGECNSANTTPDGTLLAVGNGRVQGASSASKKATKDPEGASECDVQSDALVLDQEGDLTISGTLTEDSDRRLKTDITPLGDRTLAKLTELRPVRYRFEDQRTHPSGEQIGLVAQDVQKQFPSLVSTNSEGVLSLAYPRLTAVLLKGLQEQQTQIDRQRAALEEKQEQIDALKEQVQRIDEVESRLAALESERSAETSRAAGWGRGAPLRALGLLLVGGVLGVGLLHLRRRWSVA